LTMNNIKSESYQHQLRYAEDQEHKGLSNCEQIEVLKRQIKKAYTNTGELLIQVVENETLIFCVCLHSNSVKIHSIKKLPEEITADDFQAIFCNSYQPQLTGIRVL